VVIAAAGLFARQDDIELGDRLHMSREPNNPADCNAILLLSARGKPVGYVAREAACLLAPMLDAACIDRLRTWVGFSVTAA